jgi:hypothetical protein
MVFFRLKTNNEPWDDQMKAVVILFSFFLLNAQAGWFKDFCTKHLIADDPYQFEQTDLSRLVRYYDRLKTRREIGTIDSKEESLYWIVRQELIERKPYASYQDFEQIKKALED